MIKKLSTAILCLVLFCHGIQLFATEKSYNFDELDKYLESELHKANIPGTAIAIVDKDSILFEGTYGNCTSIEEPFLIGSLSKSFTAMAIMQLVEDGKLDLDSPISAYLPQANEGNAITVRQLLNQTSGISTYATQENYKITKNQGTHVYANANYGLLGQIIASVSGMSYADYIQTNIFDPIGMNNSYTTLDDAQNNGLIDGYRNYFGFPINQTAPYPNADFKGWLSVPAGYLIASALDMAKYLQVYLNGGANILSQESIHRMFYDNAKIMDEDYYGMGWILTHNYTEPMLYHGGLVENYVANMFILPDSEIAVIMLINTNDNLVANSIMANIGHSVTLMLLDEEPIPIGNFTYLGVHLLINAICLGIILLCLIPLFRIKKWNVRPKELKSHKRICFFVGVHIIIPTALLLLPSLLGSPMFVIKGFVPDVYIILLAGAIILYGTGGYKVIVTLRKQ